MPRTRYEIVLRGPLGPRLVGAVDGFDVVSRSTEATHLVGWVPDQASLQGTLRRISDFGLELISLRELPQR